MNEKRECLPERHEKKYWVNRYDLDALRRRLSLTMSRDPHADKRGNYLIRCLYFDDAYDAAYCEKMDGVPGREKYRLRIYNLSDKLIFLERKRKLGDLIQKSSCRISRRLCEELMAGRPDSLLGSGEPLLNDLFVQMRTRLLRPKVLVQYTREAFVYPVEDVRVTFDKQLVTCPGSIDLFNKQLLMVSPLDDWHEILEVKYNSYLPDSIARMLTDVTPEYGAISKYILCRCFDKT